jgi:hypothetical protein
MSHTPTCIPSGRAAAIARRQALSAGKAALPPATERVRNGERSAALAPPVHAPRLAALAPSGEVSSETAAHGSTHPVMHAVALRPDLLGKRMSMERRRRLSAGKGAFGASRGGNGSHGGNGGAGDAAATTAVAAPVAPAASSPASRPDLLGKRLSMERRRRLSAGKGALTGAPGGAGGGSAPGADSVGIPGTPSTVAGTPSGNGASAVGSYRSPRPTGRQIVTASRIGNGSEVTGADAGVTLPISGTQNIATAAGFAFRSGGPKVGHARTRQGGIVSGSLVRSTVPVTGDEAGARIHITGEADQRLEDDLTERSASGAPGMAQFQRQIAPNGRSGFGTNLGGSSNRAGSRERQRSAPLESTETGLPITGSAVGRTIRVTGDEPGACRQVTGDQYLSPARAQAECGGRGGGTAPAAQLGAMRRDPVSGAKVSVAETWGRQRVTGCNVEHDPRVTGDAAGSCAVLTGTPYHGTGTVAAICPPTAADGAVARLAARPGAAAVTGDTPLNVEHVTGAGRGAKLAISGTPYYGDPTTEAVTESSVAAVAARFSIRSPQLAAQLKAADVAAPQTAAERITGSFAIGLEKVTGNLEFRFQPRRAAHDDARPAHSRVSGEGSISGRRITNGSWGDHPAVTGTEGSAAAQRNPSERDGKPHTFAGAVRFKSQAKQEDSKQLVTGLFGWSSKSGAKVTLSGGAQG